jgi:phosphoribosylanthranilate isomerase
VIGVDRFEAATKRGRLLVKICGIRTLEDARFAVDTGADALGFVFWYMSPRRIDPAGAAEIAAELPASVLRVGVFVDAPREELERVSDEVGLDVLQLHGEEPPEALAGLSRPALKAVRVGPRFTADEALRYSKSAAGIVVDTRLPGETQLPGGTGVPFDWSLVADLAEQVPFLMLAGGLSPANVASAVREVRPHGVDVSSGVERMPGRKDPAKVKAFIAAARAVEAELGPALAHGTRSALRSEPR